MSYDIKLIDKDTDLSTLKISHMDWDLVINGRPYYVVKIKGYVHCIGGRHGENDLWAYPRDEEPSYENLIEYDMNEPVRWGIICQPKAYVKSKWDETEVRTSSGVIITRNDKPFMDVKGGLSYGIDKARTIIADIDEHPLELNEIDFDKKCIGMKVWWRSEPAIIESYIDGQGCVILEPDGIDEFTVPAEFKEEESMYYEDGFVKTSIFDEHIWWFREDNKEDN